MREDDLIPGIRAPSGPTAPRKSCRRTERNPLRPVSSNGSLTVVSFGTENWIVIPIGGRRRERRAGQGSNARSARGAPVRRDRDRPSCGSATDPDDLEEIEDMLREHDRALAGGRPNRRAFTWQSYAPLLTKYLPGSWPPSRDCLRSAVRSSISSTATEGGSSTNTNASTRRFAMAIRTWPPNVCEGNLRR